MNDVVKVEQSANLISVIERAATSPDVDVEKMERLLQMHERIAARQAETAFNSEMALAQAEMRPVSADASNPQTRSKYASYNALDRALRPIYGKHGFALSFDTGESPIDLHVRVICKVLHNAGHRETYHLDMPADGKGAKGNDVMTKTHATMSAVSYGRRGLLKMIFNISEGEADDDGNAASAPPIKHVSKSQVEKIRKALKELPGEGHEMALLNAYKIDSVEHFQAAAFDDVIRKIEQRKARLTSES